MQIIIFLDQLLEEEYALYMNIHRYVTFEAFLDAQMSPIFKFRTPAVNISFLFSQQQEM